MKKYLLIILIPFIAFTFTGNPPGWNELTLPINDQINDIYFADSLNGWLVTYGDDTPVDTGYIMHTSNGGSNWEVQYSHLGDFNNVRFFDINTGYVFGNNPNSIFLKTTNGGANWLDMSGDIPIFYSRDMQFINRDTGWICSDITIGRCS